MASEKHPRAVRAAESFPAQPTEMFASEEARIRSVYAQREKFRARYAWFNPGHAFTLQQVETRLLGLLKRFGFEQLETKRILEVGCGTGFWLRQLMKWGARPENIFGVDLLRDQIEEALRLCPSSMQLRYGNAAQLEFSDESFDLVFQFTVFTSILDLHLKKRIAAEMMRVVNRGGMIVWYDFHMNNPWNADVRGVRKREIRELFPQCVIELQRATLAPPLARFVAPYSFLGCRILEMIPWLRTHYLGAIQKG